MPCTRCVEQVVVVADVPQSFKWYCRCCCRRPGSSAAPAAAARTFLTLRVKREGIEIEEFPQSVPNLTEASQNLFDLTQEDFYEPFGRLVDGPRPKEDREKRTLARAQQSGSRTRAERKDTQWPRTRFAYGTTKTLRLLPASTPRRFPTA
jgi:hypothetical protein